MENASKALIIAGAILLSILIIALGMRIYNSSSSSAANADLSATEIASFNSTFEAYEGSQKGSSVRTLITAVISSNKANPDKQILINATKKTTNNVTTWEKNTSAKYQTPDTVTNNKTYTVKFEYDDTGLLRNIIIN